MQTGFENADDHKYLQTIAAKYGIYFSRAGNGICHQVNLERFAVPGKTLLGSDSHTPTAGGIGMLGIGAGGLDVAVAMGGGEFYIKMPHILGIKLTGKLNNYVTAKDVILEILRILSVKGGVGKLIEYFGDGIKTLSIPERATITNMGAELGALSSIFPSDDVTREFLKAQKREKDYVELKADHDAKYAEIIEINLSELEPLIAKPHMPDNVVKVNDIEVPVGITALDGQDFFYHLEIKEVQYWRVVEPLDTKEYILWPTCKEKKLIAIGYLDKPNASDVKNMRQEMKIGDKVIAYLGKNRIGGIGTITGEYEDYTEKKPEDKDFFNGQFWRRRKVQWDFLPTEGEFWQLSDPLPGVRRTVFRLNKKEYDEVLRKIGKNGPEPLKPVIEITKEELLKEIFLKEEKFEQICSLLENSKKKQLIFQGPPGTGKTFVAQKIALYLTQSEDRIETIQFHPSYSYEDFIEGYRPKNGKFELEAGIFKLFCERARKDGDKKYILIIDEINRGNLSKIFGELLYLLEYRDKEAKLTYSQKEFSIPENIIIIGTMNTADRSLAIMDYALRRRFYFVDIKCETKRLEEWLNENGCELKTSEIIGAIENMNKQIEEEMHSKDFAIGHSYFMREGLDSEKLEEVMDFGVKPLLKEYFFDKEEKVEEITGVMNKFYNKENSEKQ